jgi:outer membrane protein TolC
VVLWVLGAVLAAPVGAQTVLSADDAVKTALEHNLSLQRTSWDLDAKRRQLDNAWGVFVPSTSLSTGVSRSNTATDLLGNAVTPSWASSMSASVSLSVNPSVFADLKTVALNYRSGQLTYTLAKRTLEKNVRQVYYNLLLEQENLKLAQANIALKQKSLDDTTTKYKNGLAPQLDVFSAQVALAQLKPQYDSFETTFLNDLGQLKVYLGLPLSQDIALQGSLDQAVESSIDLTPAQGSTESPDVQTARLQLEADRLSLQSTQEGAWFPTLTMSYSTVPTLSNPYGAGYAWADSQGALSLQLSYSLDSLLPWTTSREKLNQAEDAIRSANSVLDETKINSELTRTNAVRKIRQAVRSLETQTLNVELAQKTYDQSVDAYQKGTKDLLTLQGSEADLNQAKYDLLSQRYTLISTLLDLEYELDVPFGTLLGGKK